jgi:DNA-directed RNA polymerase subunit RPC12/RpoP
MLGIPLRYAVLIVGGFELAVALICMFGKRAGLQLGCLVWLATNYLAYRIGMLTMHCHPQATCIGCITDPLHLYRGPTGYSMELITFYLMLGSYVTCIWLWFKKKEGKTSQAVATKPNRVERGQEAIVRSLKISCTACGGHIEFPTNFFGERISCPHCQANIILQKTRNLKMSCMACEGNIEFPDHAIGQKIPCPHCKMDITLKCPA